MAQIASSIREFGWTVPVLLDGANGIIAGHGRVLAARIGGFFRRFWQDFKLPIIFGNCQISAVRGGRMPRLPTRFPGRSMTEISLQRSRVVCDRLGKGRATLHNDIHDGLMPPPIQLGSRWSAWPSDEIDQIIRARIAGWDKAQLRELVKELIARRQTAAPIQGRIAGVGGDDRHVSIGS